MQGMHAEMTAKMTNAYRRELGGTERQRDDGAMIGMGGTRDHSVLDSATVALLLVRPSRCCVFFPRRCLRVSSRRDSSWERGAAARIAC